MKFISNLKSTIGNENVSIKIINRNLNSNYKFHTRTLVTNFSILKSDDGFNLVPSKFTDGDLSIKRQFLIYPAIRKLRRLEASKKNTLKRF